MRRTSHNPSQLELREMLIIAELLSREVCHERYHIDP